MIPYERNKLAEQPIKWTGNLSDDCGAEWAGLLLRAEWMDGDFWWWSVYDMKKGEVIIDDSNAYSERFIDAESARNKAESVAKNYIKVITQEVKAKYTVIDTFKITGRGLVLFGDLNEGFILTGYIIEFTALSYLRLREITGIDMVRNYNSSNETMGLLIKCNNDDEIEELRNWKPENITATIYQAGVINKI